MKGGTNGQIFRLLKQYLRGDEKQVNFLDSGPCAPGRYRRVYLYRRHLVERALNVLLKPERHKRYRHGEHLYMSL